MREQRILNQSLSEVRAVQPEGDEGKPIIEGNGIVLNQRSEKLGFFIEIIDPDSLRDTNFDDAVSLFNHNSDYVLGAFRNKTLELSITREAVRYRSQVPPTQTIRDLVLTTIDLGYVRGSSFMFSIAENGDEWEEESDGTIIRYVRKIERVYEMGPVTMPAYSQTTTDIAKRSFDDWIKEFRKNEKKKEVFFRRELAKKSLELLRV